MSPNLVVPRQQLRSLFTKAGVDLPPYTPKLRDMVRIEPIDKMDYTTTWFHLLGLLSYAEWGVMHDNTVLMLSDYFTGRVDERQMVAHLKRRYTLGGLSRHDEIV